MLVFQFYELLASYGHYLKKQILPIQYKALILDFGCVYKYKDPALMESIAQITSSNDTNLGRLFQDYEIGKISFNSLKNMVDERVNSPIPASPQNDQSAVLERDENIAIALDRLRAEGFKTALLTNVGYKDELFQNSAISPANLNDFDVIVESCRVGLRKPNPRIYELTARKLHIRVEECVYVDELARNCRGAEIAGMKSVQIIGSDTKRVVDQLSKLFGLELF